MRAVHLVGGAAMHKCALCLHLFDAHHCLPLPLPLQCNSYVPAKGMPGNFKGNSMPYSCPQFSTQFAISYHTYKVRAALRFMVDFIYKAVPRIPSLAFLPSQSCPTDPFKTPHPGSPKCADGPKDDFSPLIPGPLRI